MKAIKRSSFCPECSLKENIRIRIKDILDHEVMSREANTLNFQQVNR